MMTDAANCMPYCRNCSLKVQAIEVRIDKVYGPESSMKAKWRSLQPILQRLQPDWLIAEAERDDRIILRKGFVPDGQVSAYLGLADTVAAPFAQTLTSGPALLAMAFANR
jgi:hypothetical protein